MNRVEQIVDTLWQAGEGKYADDEVMLGDEEEAFGLLLCTAAEIIGLAYNIQKAKSSYLTGTREVETLLNKLAMINYAWGEE